MGEYYNTQMQNRMNINSQMNPPSRGQIPSLNTSVEDPLHMSEMSQMTQQHMNQTHLNHQMSQMSHISQMPYMSQMPQMSHMPSISQLSQMNPQMADQRLKLEKENVLGKDLNISESNINEGYLSPASAIAQGWTPHVVYVPSPMIHMIPSPMPSSMIPSPLLPPMSHLTSEAITRFNHENSGLGLVNPEMNLENQELVQSSFEDMLSSLGLLHSNNTDPQGLDGNFQKWTAFKGKDRTLYKCPWTGCEKSNFLIFLYIAFTRPYNLKSHYRGHTGERPFVCSICFTGFARKHDLKRHAKIHDGLKSFSCPFCHKCFTRSDALRRHLKNDRSGKESSCSMKQAQITQEDIASSSKD